MRYARYPVQTHYLKGLGGANNPVQPLSKVGSVPRMERELHGSGGHPGNAILISVNTHPPYVDVLALITFPKSTYTTVALVPRGSSVGDRGAVPVKPIRAGDAGVAGR